MLTKVTNFDPVKEVIISYPEQIRNFSNAIKVLENSNLNIFNLHLETPRPTLWGRNFFSHGSEALRRNLKK